VSLRFRFGGASIGARLLLGMVGAFCCRSAGSAPTTQPDRTSPTEPNVVTGTQLTDVPPRSTTLEALYVQVRELAAKAGGKVGVAVVHVESGRSVTVGAQQWLPLQSVFKLPLAVAVLKDVQTGQARLDQMLTVRAEDRAPGVASNEKKWAQVPRTVSVRQLLEYSLIDSDNTASDKLLELIGGPDVLTERLRSLGFDGIEVRAPTKAMGPSGELPNEATPEAIAGLLASLQRGEVLRAPERALLWDILQRTRTGERRIRAGLPPGSPVLDKTGTGANGAATNDAAVVTLPGSGGHLAIAVMIAASPLPARGQEDLIAEIARAAFNTFAPPP
jgi:beta-lactamase class A